MNCNEYITTTTSDPILASHLIDFCSSWNINNSTTEKRFKNFIQLMCPHTITDFNWNLLCIHMEHSDDVLSIKKYILNFYKYLLEKQISLGPFSSYLLDNLWILDPATYLGTSYNKFFFIGSTPQNFYLYQVPKRTVVIYMNVTNDSLRQLLKEFLKDEASHKLFEHHLASFISTFESSLLGCNITTYTITTFNEHTFDCQFLFYEDLIKDYCRDAQFQYMRLIRDFYLFLQDISNQEIFSPSSGINRNYLRRSNFRVLYKAGYRVVYLNPHDPIPSHDKWLLSPNGYENYTTTMKSNDFLTIDFSRVKSDELR